MLKPLFEITNSLVNGKEVTITLSNKGAKANGVDIIVDSPGLFELVKTTGSNSLMATYSIIASIKAKTKDDIKLLDGTFDLNYKDESGKEYKQVIKLNVGGIVKIGTHELITL